MNVRTFIERPLFSMVISVVIVSLGVISLVNLPIEKYPDIAPPSIYVWASYPGASAEAVQKAVVAPLEEAINGVEGMMYMTSSSSNGSASITIIFEQGINADMAAVNVQNRVVRAQSVLPAEVLRFGVITEKMQPGQLRTIGLESPKGTYDEQFLTNYLINNIKTAVQRIRGVGNVEVFGAPYALRIWLKPDLMALRHLVPSDITSVLEEQNVEASIGTLGENSGDVMQYALRYTGRKASVTDFENLVVVSSSTGEELRLKEIADIELGTGDYNFCNRINGHPGVICSISQIAGSNATQINLAIDAILKEVEKTLPTDVRIVTFDNTNDFLFASIKEVIFTLVVAIFLVLLVVYFFLQDLRATLIPAVSIIVSLVGTFAFLYAAGFSINLLTLFALVLVIGTVVDDSIVVVEAVQTRFESGYQSSKRAAVDAMGGLTSALFTTSLIFMVVFIPVSFTGGTTGVFYKQFGLTMAVAVGISFINSISLSAALCALILKPVNPDVTGISSKMRTAYSTSFNAVLNRYKGIIMLTVRKKRLVACCITFALILGMVLMKSVPTGFVPEEDTGCINVDINTPAGYTQHKTEQVLAGLSERIREIPGVQDFGGVVGFSLSGSGSNHAMAFLQLKPWNERKDQPVSEVIDRINEILSSETEVTGFASTPGMIDGYGIGGGFEFSVQDQNGRDIGTFFEVTEKFLAKLNERPEIKEAYSGYDINYPQFAVDVDASRCKKMGVSPSSVLNELGSFMGSSYVSNFNLFNKIYQVTMQLHPEDRRSMENLDEIFVRSDKGSMLPVSQFLTLKKEYRPQALNRFNMFGSISVNGNVADGSSSGEVIKAVREVADENLPKGYKIEFSGITREESRTSGNIPVILFISLFFMYLVMVALYESLFIPLAVLFSVPFGLVGTFLMAKCLGIENNIYLQVGLVMLIGLLCKTAVLLTEYATQCRKAGMTLRQSAFVSAKIRLRPILMTSLTMIFGMLPLLFASGVGANGSRTIGAGIVGGVLFGTLGLLFFTPALFVIFQTIQERFKPVEFRPCEDPIIIREMEAFSKDR